jgi:hypothetical protein
MLQIDLSPHEVFLLNESTNLHKIVIIQPITNQKEVYK